MRKLCLLLAVVFACGAGMAGKQENVQRYYDDTEINCSLRLPGKIRADKFLWQLTTPHGRVMAQGQVTGRNMVKVPLKFDKLKPGISLKCLLQIKLDKEIVAQQKITIYSKEIFKNIDGRPRKAGVGTALPKDEIARLNELGLNLPDRSSGGFDDQANKMVFCDAKKYCDNVDMLEDSMKRGVTVVMFAPDDESEIFVPQKNFSKITLISSENTKIKGSLGVICNKEKISIICTGGQGALVEVKYNRGKIIIVADAVNKDLSEIPDAALMLKDCLTE